MRYFKYIFLLLVFFTAESYAAPLILIDGMNFFNKEKILTNLSQVRIKKIKSYLASQYTSQGFFNTKVTTKYKKNTLQIYIEEGARCQIKSLQIQKASSDIYKAIDIKSLSYQFKNKPCSLENKKKAMELVQVKLLKKGYFNHKYKSDKFHFLTSQMKEAHLIFDFDNLVQYKLIINGNSKLSRRRLLSEIYEPEFLKLRTNFTEYVLQRFKTAYYTLGYDGTKIRIKTEPYKIIVSIREGTRVFIDEVKIRGRFSQPISFYEKYILNHSSKFIKSGYFNLEEFELGLKNLSNHLKNKGFVEFEVTSKNYKFLDDRKKVKITINVNEGSLAVISKINFIENNSFSHAQLSQVLDLQPSDPLNFYKIEGSFKKLKSFYNGLGYLEMRLEKSQDIIQYDPIKKEAVLNLKLVEGQQIHIKDVSVKGNEKTKIDFIVQLSKLKKGNILTSDKISQAISNLDNSGIFSFVNIEFESSLKARRDVTISVQELKPGQVRTNIGLNKETGISAKVYGEISYSNIGGRGRRLVLSSELKRNFTFDDLGFDYSVTALYSEPLLFSTHMKGLVTTSLGKNVTEIEDVKSNNYKISFQKTKEVGFSVQKQLNYKTTLNFNLWSYNIIDNFTIKDSNTKHEDSEKVATLGPTLSLDYRDNKFLPTKGFYFNTSLLYSTPSLGSSEGVHFTKLEGYFTYYQRLSFFIAAQLLRVGYLKNLSTLPESGVPKSYAFFLGGFSTLRGYSSLDPNNRLPFADEFKDSGQDPDATKNFIKDSSYFILYKTEARIPLFNKFNGVLFYDVGSVIVSHIKQKTSFAHSTGLGLRYETILGTINFEWAFKIGKLRDQEPRSRIHFYIGAY